MCYASGRAFLQMKTRRGLDQWDQWDPPRHLLNQLPRAGSKPPGIPTNPARARSQEIAALRTGSGSGSGAAGGGGGAGAMARDLALVAELRSEAADARSFAAEAESVLSAERRRSGHSAESPQTLNPKP